MTTGSSQMPDPEKRGEILDPKLEPGEREELLETMRLLERARPAPPRAFKLALARRLQLNLAKRKQLQRTARLLKQARPVPRPAFSGELGRQLAESTGPRRLRLLIGAYAGSGLVLLAVVAVGLAGVGPLASG